MLRPETPYPNPGSYALFLDSSLPAERQAFELVRIIRYGAGADPRVTLSFPLRDGASGNRIADPAEMIDATPLTAAEAREFHDLDRALAGRGPSVGEDGVRKQRLTKTQRARAARRDALKKRIVYGPVLDRLLRFARRRGLVEQRRAA